jgi:ABC-type amino acid transport system permease subunit
MRAIVQHGGASQWIFKNYTDLKEGQPLFKDTSPISIITVTELTRAYGPAATVTVTCRFLELGLLTAAHYLPLSLPQRRK